MMMMMLLWYWTQYELNWLIASLVGLSNQTSKLIFSFVASIMQEGPYLHMQNMCMHESKMHDWVTPKEK